MFLDFGETNLKGKKIAVALSGGCDSMALLHLLYELQSKNKFSLSAINVEHGIRGDQSKKDSLFVKEYCEKLNVELFSYSVNCPEYANKNKLTLEQAGRILRYQCFEKALLEKKCDLVATAHHLGDNAESVLFNLFRGTALKGLAGINSNYQDKIIRPLLNCSKEEILEYVTQNEIPYVQDSTNFDDKYTRNFIRLNIIPEIKKIFPQAEKSIMRLSNSVKEDGEFLDNLAQKSIEPSFDGYYLKLPLDPVLIKRATIQILQLLGVEKDWQQSHLNDVVKLSENSTSKSINLLNKVVAIKEYNRIFFFVDDGDAKKNLLLPLPETAFEFYGKKYQVKQLNSIPKNLKNGLYLDKDKVPKTAVIRTKQNGDVFTKFGGGSKKLNDYFTDKKIPSRLRDRIPLLTDGNEILAIFSLAISDKVKVDENTKNIIKIN